MVKINLFIVCPEDSDALKKLKGMIKQLCFDLNIEYSKHKNVKTIPVTYDDHERRRIVGKKYIKNKADIVIFLVDKYDSVLEHELLLAVKRSKYFFEPEVVVYTFNDWSEKWIDGTIGKNAWIYHQPKNEEVFMENVKHRITENVRKFKSRRRVINWLKLVGLLLITAIIVFASSSGYLFDRWQQEYNQRRLLIVGGGSARNYIEESLLNKKNGLSTKYWIYTNMPSGEAYRLLAEENMNYTKDFDSLPYYPVIVSAQKAKGDEAFCGINNEKKEQFKDKGIVIGVYIGNDNLVVYGSNDAFNEIQIGQDSTLTTKVLDSIIAVSKDSIMNKKTPPRMIYTTKNKSGTKNAYDSVCDNLIAYDSICDKLNIDHLFFNIDSITGHKTNNKWLTLGSEYYSPKENKYRLKVVNGDTLNIYKQMYVYFMMYKDGNNYKLPHATEGFLKEILKKTEVGDSVIKSIKNIEVTDKILYDNFSAIKQQ